MKKFLMVSALCALSLSAFAGTDFEQKKEKAQEQTEETFNDMGRGLKKAGRSIKDETCELINGKMECAADKAKHSIQNGADNVEDAVD